MRFVETSLSFHTLVFFHNIADNSLRNEYIVSLYKLICVFLEYVTVVLIVAGYECMLECIELV